MKKVVLGLIGLLLVVVMVSGCTDNTQQYGKKIYQGNWKVDASHFAIHKK